MNNERIEAKGRIRSATTGKLVYFGYNQKEQTAWVRMDEDTGWTEAGRLAKNEEIARNLAKKFVDARPEIYK